MRPVILLCVFVGCVNIDGDKNELGQEMLAGEFDPDPAARLRSWEVCAAGIAGVLIILTILLGLILEYG